ncbi:uncharacterized protein LOC122260011 [Penaeus japonicus]|uniref:uncharacterized protein LOC122260011 n=1 Tax=Penaeus japonicus TaxID=27405 RepID=UPI001C70F6A0|nr:uncharacterized protein LOC122260011 [Penaeus japonicus]
MSDNEVTINLGEPQGNPTIQEVHMEIGTIHNEIALILRRLDEETEKRTELERAVKDLTSEVRSLASEVATKPNLNLTGPVTSTPTPVNPYYNSNDIEKLCLKDLHHVWASMHIKDFVDQIKRLGFPDEHCKNIAITRMDKELRLFIVGEMQKFPNGGTIDDMENILSCQFSRRYDAIDAYRELYNLSYNLDDDPRAFVNQFIVKFRTIRSFFPNTPAPNEEDILHEIMMENLPAEIKAAVKVCARRGMGDDFLRELEKERVFWRSRVNKVDVRAKGNPEWTRVWVCGWCQDGSKHLRINCPRKPEAGSCFDCLAPKRRKGHAGCPGRQDAVRRDRNTSNENVFDGTVIDRSSEKLRTFIEREDILDKIEEKYLTAEDEREILTGVRVRITSKRFQDFVITEDTLSFFVS